MRGSLHGISTQIGNGYSSVIILSITSCATMITRIDHVIRRTSIIVYIWHQV